MANLNQQWAIVSVLALGLWGCATGKPPTIATDATPNNKTAGDNTAAIAQSAAQSTTPITNAKRTVALSSLAADILYQLNPEKLVGVAHDRSVAQHEKLSQYPNIGDGRDFDVKAIIRLRPDLVVGIAGVHERVLTQLEEAGIPTQRYTLNGWEGLFTTIENLARATRSDPTPLLDRYALLRSESESGNLTEPIAKEEAAKSDESTEGKSDESDESTESKTGESTESKTGESTEVKSDETEPAQPEETQIEPESETGSETEPEQTSDETEQDNSDSPKMTTDRDRTSTLILASRDPLFSLNRKSWGGSAIEPFAHNIAADIDENRSAAGYVTLDPEAITQADPDTILIVETPGSADPLADFESLPFWQELRAVKNDRVFLVDYYGLIKPATLADIDTTIEQLSKIFDLPHRTASELKLGDRTSLARHSRVHS